MDREPSPDRPTDGNSRPPRRTPEGASAAPVPGAFDEIWRDHHRDLVGLATRMLRDPAAAEDVVQEAFGRLMRVELDEIEDPRAWLTVVVRRLCLNRMRSAYSRREAAAGASPPEGGPAPSRNGGSDPSDRVTLDGQVQNALAVVLDRLTPAERTAFVLHDVFGFPYAVIGEIVGRTETACRQLASRARRTVRSEPPSPGTEPAPARSGPASDGLVAERFIAAAAGGDIAELVAVLDPEVVGEATVAGGARFGRFAGAHDVAEGTLEFVGPASGATLVPVPIDGVPGIVAIIDGRVRVVIRLDVVDGIVRHIHAHVVRPIR